MKIFISYGHDKFEPVVQRIYTDLLDRGYIVFKDNTETGIKLSSFFDSSIDNAIESCDFFISIVSAHSTRENSVCLDEITRAREYDKGILPIRFEVVKVPLLICRYQWIDLILSLDENGDPVYREQDYIRVISNIIEILSSVETNKNVRNSDFETKILPRPFDFSRTVASLSKNYTSRSWVEKKIEYWLEDESWLCWLIGSAGSGKTSILANMSVSGKISAIHLCQANYLDSTNPQFILLSLVYQLCMTNHDYRDILINTIDIDVLKTMSIPQIFHEAIIVCFEKIDCEDIVTLAIDGIDELSPKDQSMIIQILTNGELENVKNLKFIVSSRPNPSILSATNNSDGTVIVVDSEVDEESSNFKDCVSYTRKVNKELNLNLSEKDIISLVDKSECNYLYLRYCLEDIKKCGVVNITRFPKRIGGFYSSFFHGKFPLDSEMYQDFESNYIPILEIIISAKEPMSTEDLCSIANISKRGLLHFLNYFDSFVRNDYGVVSLYHRSLYEWLTNEEYSGEYYIDPSDGNKSILKCILSSIDNIAELSSQSYIRKYLPNYLIEFNKVSEMIRLITRDDEDSEYFFIRLSEYDAKHIVNVLLEINEIMDESEFNSVLRNSIFYLRYYRFVDKAFEVCDMLLSNGRICGLNYACVLTQKANVHHYEKQERYDLSLPLFEEAVRILERLDVSPVRDYMLSLSYEGIGICYKNFKQFDRASEYYSKAVGFTESAYSLSPGKNTRRGLAIDYSNLALSFKWAGNVEKTTEYYTKAHKLFQENYYKHPSFDTRRDYSVSLNRIGDLETDYQKAMSLYMESMELVKTNLSIMDSIQTNRDLARSYENFGKLHKLHLDNSAAVDNYKKCIEILDKILNLYPSVQNLKLYIRAVEGLLSVSEDSTRDDVLNVVLTAINHAVAQFPTNEMMDLRDSFVNSVSK